MYMVKWSFFVLSNQKNKDPKSKQHLADDISSKATFDKNVAICLNFRFRLSITIGLLWSTRKTNKPSHVVLLSIHHIFLHSKSMFLQLRIQDCQCPPPTPRFFKIIEIYLKVLALSLSKNTSKRLFSFTIRQTSLRKVAIRHAASPLGLIPGQGRDVDSNLLSQVWLTQTKEFCCDWSAEPKPEWAGLVNQSPTKGCKNV